MICFFRDGWKGYHIIDSNPFQNVRVRDSFFFTQWRNILVLCLTKRCQGCLVIAPLCTKHRFAKMSTRRWWAIIPRWMNPNRKWGILEYPKWWLFISFTLSYHKTWPEIAGVPNSQISRWFKGRSEKHWSWSPFLEHPGPTYPLSQNQQRVASQHSSDTLPVADLWHLHHVKHSLLKRGNHEEASILNLSWIPVASAVHEIRSPAFWPWRHGWWLNEAEKMKNSFVEWDDEGQHIESLKPPLPQWHNVSVSSRNDNLIVSRVMSLIPMTH